MKDSLQYIIPWIVTVLRYFIFAGIPFLIFYILFPNVFSKNKIQDRLAKRKDFIREISHSLKTTLILVGIGLLFLKTPLRAYTRIYDNLADYSYWWIPLSLVLSLIVHDTYFYWMHRTVHHPRLYKYVHLLHHKSVNPSPWASYSFHFFEGILEAMIVPILLLLIPMHPLSLLLFGMISFSINVYGHLGYEIAPRWFRHSFLFEIINTSIYHNAHHAKFNGNYGLYFRVWDRLMGTEYPDYVEEYDKIQRRRFGEVAQPKTWKRAFLLIGFMVSVGLSSAYAQSSIEGKWKNNEKGVVVLIYEQDGKYFGQLAAADDPKVNQKIQEKGEIVLLKNFEKKSDAAFCCGTIYQPKKKRTINASLVLKNGDTLIVNGKYRGFSGSQTWTKLKGL